MAVNSLNNVTTLNNKKTTFNKSMGTAQSSNAHFRHTRSGELHYDSGKSFYSAVQYSWIICPTWTQTMALFSNLVFKIACKNGSALAQCRGLFKHPMKTKSKKAGHGESSKNVLFKCLTFKMTTRKYFRENIQHLCFLVCALTYDNMQCNVFLCSVYQACLQSHLYATADSVSFEHSNCECSE